MNAWYSRIDKPDRPDFVLFDLDPSEDVGFREVVEVALVVKQALDALGLISFPKTSSAEGMHVLVPVERRYMYGQTREFCEIVAGGRLYFAGAEEARPAMARLVEAARAAEVAHVASCDQHELSDPEISEEPDYDSTWPPHCLLGTHGAEKISETKQLDPLPLPLVPMPAPTL